MSRWKGIKTIEYTQSCDEALVIALGFFDCLHLGHVKLIDSAKLLAFKTNSKCAVFTFENNLFDVLKIKNGGQILDFNERVTKLNDLRVDYCVKAKFDNEFSHQSPLDFLENVTKGKDVKGIVVGSDYTFGKKGKGNVKLLTKWCKDKGITLIVEQFLEDKEGKISSTRIRKLLVEGKIDKANALLGQPYFIIGKVTHGEQRGRNLGFATANVEYAQDTLKIKDGVYYTKILVDGVWLKAVTNVGSHPTFDDEHFNIESYILSYSGDLYGKKITIRFIQRIRDIQKFNSKEALAERISNDVKFAYTSNM